MNVQQEDEPLGQRDHEFGQALETAEQKIQELLTCYHPHSRQGEQAIVGMGILTASKAELCVTSGLFSE